MFAVAAVIAGLLVSCLQHNAVGAELVPPQNVTLVTLNTNYVLSWDWDQSHAVTFTTQYVAKFKLQSKKKTLRWSVACENATRRSCDLTGLNLHYLGSYVLRVRASANGRHSDWVEKAFCPDKDAVVGPPSKVDLSPAGSVLDVVIADPLTSSNGSMKELLRELYYHIVYWEGPAGSQPSGIQTLSSSVNLVTLPNLQAWTWYCVRVQSRADFYNKSSGFTPTRCVQTEGVTAWWLIILYFLGSLAFCFGVVLLAIYASYRSYKTVKDTFFPPNKLPSHFRQYFCDSPGSDIPRLLNPDSESELLCDKMIICPEAILEIHNPPPETLPAPPSGPEADSSGRHSRQDSGSSRDSGVYSTGGTSGPRQPDTHPTPGELESSWQSGCDPEQVKMQDMAPELKNLPLITDEGVVDMSV